MWCKSLKMLTLAEVGRAVNDANMADTGGAEGTTISGAAAAGAGLVWGEEGGEEHTQIQSSLPFYFEHMFGSRMGGVSQSEGHALSPVTSPSQVPSHVPISRASSTKAVTVLSESRPSPTQCCEGVQTVEDSMESALEVGGDSAVLFSSSSGTTTCGCGDSRLASDMTRTGERGSGELPVLSTVCRKRARTSSHESEKRTKKRKQQSIAAKEEEESYCCPPCCTALALCSKVGSNVNILSVVVQVNAAMDVACKRGLTAGQTVQMSSLLLSDPTKSYFKLSLWRNASAWAERVAIGDIVYLKNIRLTVWRGEVVGTTVNHSSMLNLHQPGKKLPAKVRAFLPDKALADLMRWGKKHYAYLFRAHSIPKSQREVKFRTSGELMGDTLVHMHVKLLHLVSSGVVLFADKPGMDVQLHLLGVAGPRWHSQLSSGLGQVWELLYVAVIWEGTQTQDSVCTLQTTSRTRLQVLNQTCDVALEILKKVPSDLGNHETTSSSAIQSGLSVVDILSSRRTGMFRVEAKATCMDFVLPDSSRLSVEAVLVLPPSEMVTTLCQAIYVGCETCLRPLVQDHNGVYCQCMSCIIKSPGGGYPSSSYFFWPMRVVLTDSSQASMVLTASSAIVPGILGVDGREVVQASLSNNEAKVQGLSARGLFEPAPWLIKCLVIRDENSFIQELSFSVLECHIT